MRSFLFLLLNTSKPLDVIPPSLDLQQILNVKCLVWLLGGLGKAWASAVLRAVTFLSLHLEFSLQQAGGITDCPWGWEGNSGQVGKFSEVTYPGHWPPLCKVRNVTWTETQDSAQAGTWIGKIVDSSQVEAAVAECELWRTWREC